MSGLPSKTSMREEVELDLARLIAAGKSPEEAARHLGFPDASRIRHAMRTKRFSADLSQAITDRLKRLAPDAVGVLDSLMRDPAVPARVRVDAAKTVLDRAGHPAVASAKLADPDDAKRPEEMTPTELAALIERLEREKSGRAVHVGGPEEPTAAPASFLD